MGGNNIRAFVQRLMPDGSIAETGPGELDSWALLPRSPIDVFAVCATLVERSGAYRHVVGPSDNENQAFLDPFDIATLRLPEWLTIARAWGAGCHPAIDEDTEQWAAFNAAIQGQYPILSESEKNGYFIASGQAYLNFFELTKVDVLPLQTLWHELTVTNRDKNIVENNNDLSGWRPAIWLMILADMACSGVGFWPRKRSGFQTKATQVQQSVLKMALERATSHDGMLTTLASNLVDSSFCAVLPKTRTSSLGCTLRSMTHNLALLPSPGLVEARWRVPSVSPPRPRFTHDSNEDEGESKTLNLLLVPFPYRFGSTCFVPHARPEIYGVENPWSYFHIDQRWLNRDGKSPDGDVTSGNELLKFVQSLLRTARTDMGEIHGVVFPELSLNEAIFDTLSTELFKDDQLEFIVAGLSEEPRKNGENGQSVRGNFAAVRARPETAGSKNWLGNHSRGKHHRWKLDRRQVERYGLTRSLPPEKNWWEGIPLGRRVIDFFVPRAGTAMTVLICEDLARTDPVQTVVRSIGPNLVLALLMDGPQRMSRWPGHYAGVLADDPGCSVLTFTSLGLISRGSTSDNTQSRSVAFFKNSLGDERELSLPQGSHAIALRLSVQSKTEHSLDGRGDGGSAFI